MQSDSSSLDTLKDNLLRAVDAEYNVNDTFFLNTSTEKISAKHI